MADAQRRARFEAVVGALAPDLFRYAFWLARDRQLAEDVVQETMIRAWKALDQLRGLAVQASRGPIIQIVAQVRTHDDKRIYFVPKQVDYFSDFGHAFTPSTSA